MRIVMVSTLSVFMMVLLVMMSMLDAIHVTSTVRATMINVQVCISSGLLLIWAWLLCVTTIASHHVRHIWICLWALRVTHDSLASLLLSFMLTPCCAYIIRLSDARHWWMSSLMCLFGELRARVYEIRATMIFWFLSIYQGTSIGDHGDFRRCELVNRDLFGLICPNVWHGWISVVLHQSCLFDRYAETLANFAWASLLRSLLSHRVFWRDVRDHLDTSFDLVIRVTLGAQLLIHDWQWAAFRWSLTVKGFNFLLFSDSFISHFIWRGWATQERCPYMVFLVVATNGYLTDAVN